MSGFKKHNIVRRLEPRNAKGGITAAHEPKTAFPEALNERFSLEGISCQAI